MNTASDLLLRYLRAATTYGRKAGKIDRNFCEQVLKISNLDEVVSDLRRQGHAISITTSGSVSLRG